MLDSERNATTSKGRRQDQDIEIPPYHPSNVLRNFTDLITKEGRYIKYL